MWPRGARSVPDGASGPRDGRAGHCRHPIGAVAPGWRGVPGVSASARSLARRAGGCGLQWWRRSGHHACPEPRSIPGSSALRKTRQLALGSGPASERTRPAKPGAGPLQGAGLRSARRFRLNYQPFVRCHAGLAVPMWCGPGRSAMPHAAESIGRPTSRTHRRTPAGWFPPGRLPDRAGGHAAGRVALAVAGLTSELAGRLLGGPPWPDPAAVLAGRLLEGACCPAPAGVLAVTWAQ
jgi:hypothetical protein